jgi:hypothetical protein
MKNPGTESGTRKKLSLQQILEGVSKTWRLQGPTHQAPLPSPVMAEHESLPIRAIDLASHAGDARPAISRAIAATFSLALLVFSFIGAIEGIANTQAMTPNLLSASKSAAKPTRTPPGLRSPTPTAPAPSPTFIATPTRIPTVSASATSPVKATMPSAAQKQTGSQMPRPISSHPTPSTTSTVQHTSHLKQNNELPLFPIIIGSLSGIAGAMLLLVIALLLLGKYSRLSAKVRLPPSGAVPWQRLRSNSPDGNMYGSSYNLHSLPAPGGFPPITRNVIPSRRGFSSVTSKSAPIKTQLVLPERPLLKPTRLKAINNNGILVDPKSDALIPSGQNSQPGAVLEEPGKERNSEVLPSLDDPFLRETLQYYILRGQLAKQSKASEQSGA